VSESNRRVLEIEIPSEVVRQKLHTIATHFQKHARLPGFRPGKAPLSLVRQKFQEDIRSQVLQELVPEYVLAEAKQNHWEPVGAPSVTDVQYTEDAPLKFRATLEVMPEIALGDYHGIKVPVEEPGVTDEEVSETLEGLQARSATYVNVEEARPLREGDFASISVQGASPGKQAGGVHLEEILCEIGGENTVPEFTANLKGAQLGDERIFDVAYPADFRDTRLAGKTDSYRVTVLGIKAKQLPPLDDEFARELGEFDSLDTLRQRIREDLLSSKLRQAEAEARKALRKKLADLHEFDVPESLLERQLDRRVDRLRRRLASQGMDPDRLEVDWNKVRASQRDDALEELKSGLVLEKIAEQEQVAVDEAELDREIEELAKGAQQPAAAVRARLTSEGALDKINSRLRIEKALDLVFQNAKVRSHRAG
jgi:trigger factor